MKPQIHRLQPDVACFQEVHGQERPGQPRAVIALKELLAGTRLDGATGIAWKRKRRPVRGGSVPVLRREYFVFVAQPAIDPDAFNAFEAGGWEDKAAGYDHFFGGITGRFVEPLLNAVSVGPGTRLLDLATGPGYVAARAAQRGASVVGVDVASAMIALAGRLHPGLDFRRADVHKLPFEAGSFDVVVGNFLILHLGRPEQAMAGFVRMLRPGGRLALTAWDVPERARFLGVFLDAVAEAGATAPKDLPTGPDFFRFSVDEEFDALMRDHGLA
jgi:SAM-dependent methyltransferase